MSAVGRRKLADAVYGLINAESGAAWRVELFVVMCFDNFNVETVPQKFRGFFGEIA